MENPTLKAEPVDHHYIPKFYLKGFTDKDGVLWVYEKGKNAPRNSTPKNEACLDNYYTFTDRGYADSGTETILGKIESHIAPTVKKLANPQFKMSDQQRSELYTFLASMFVRVPAYRDYANQQFGEHMKALTQDQARNRTKFYEMISVFEKNTGQRVENPEKLREFAASGNYTVSQESVGYNILITFRSCLAISEILEAEYSHDLIYAPANSAFLSCDNPIATIRPGTNGQAWIGAGFSLPRTQVVFPLNKRACIILRRGAKGEQIHASESRVEQINNLTMAMAQNYVYASIGNRRLARIYNERGCKVRYGKDSLMKTKPTP